MKGLILSGGKGTRLRPLTHTSAKQLLPVANKPILHYAIDALIDSNIYEIGIIVSPETGPEVEASVQGVGWFEGIKITYIRQDHPGGLAHALLRAEAYINNDDFCMYLGDNLLHPGALDGNKAAFEVEKDAQASVLFTRVDDPENYGVGAFDGNGKLTHLVEKPQKYVSDLALVGVYLFRPSIFRAASLIEPSSRGELEITDAIEQLIKEGRLVTHSRVSGWWKDTGQARDILDANRLVLESVTRKVPEKHQNTKDVHIDGLVSIHPEASVTDSTIVGPAIIGKAIIHQSYVGPYTSVGDLATIWEAEIENSIVLADAKVREVRLKESLVGTRAVVARKQKRPKGLRVLIGDDSEVWIP